MTAQPNPPSLTGPHPGQLDKTQPQRVLRHPDARLSFASFHPQTASNVPPYNLLEGSSNPKRIVIETHPGGFSHWRFVPRARLAEDVSDEGSWPRLVDVLGVLAVCDQDQWDIHKLDPFYECFVPAPPHPPTIRAKVASASSFPSSSTSSRSSVFPEGSQKKRRLSSPPSSLEEETGQSPKKRRHVIQVVDSSGDESETEATDATRPIPRTHVPGRRVRGRRGGMPRVPVFRTARSNFFENARSNVLHDETMRSTTPSPTEPPQTTATPPTSKRRKDEQRASPVAEEDNKPSKRARTHSPSSIRKAATTRLKERARARTEEFMRRMNAERDARRDARNQALMEDIIAEMPEEYTQPNGEQEQEEQDGEGPTDDDEDDDEQQQQQQRLSEALDELHVHEELIAESRRKIEELERDRPLWEAAARSRERQEREEEAARRARAERARREAEREQERARRAAAAAKAEAEAAQRRAEAQRARWAQGAWTSQRALERYRTLCESFDEAAKPAALAFEDVPWPSLRRPCTFGPEDIDWAAVETFFHTVRGHLRAQDYRIFVQNSHRRFHPDRWRARGLLTAVKDENARGMIEVAANTVAQALTPLWREARGQ